jgi:hypothetical protein
MSDLRSGGRARQAAVPGPRPVPATRPVAAPNRRPDPGPLRIAIGMTGIAAASAIATALLSSSGANADVGTVQAAVTLPADPTPVTRHVVRYVQLMAGQTAPPKAVVKQAPAPKPRVVVVTTRQSGAKP